MKSRPIVLTAVTAAACAASGCAALSLFSQTHEHTHHHGTPEIETRLRVLEERAATLEARLAALEGVPIGEPIPVLPAP